jgi:hypothetical protein
MVGARRTYLVVGDIAALFQCSSKTAGRWLAEGKVASNRTLGGHRRADPVDVAKKLASVSEYDFTHLVGNDLVRALIALANQRRITKP